MPALHVVVSILLGLQFSYFLQVFDWLSKYVKLIYQGIADSIGFVLLFINFQIVFMMIFHVLGARMDDENNFESDYDGDHNDYPYMDYWSINYLTAFRSSVGDL